MFNHTSTCPFLATPTRLRINRWGQCALIGFFISIAQYLLVASTEPIQIIDYDPDNGDLLLPGGNYNISSDTTAISITTAGSDSPLNIYVGQPENPITGNLTSVNENTINIENGYNPSSATYIYTAANIMAESSNGFGINLAGDIGLQTIVNSGTITGTTGIYIGYGSVDITNTGTITGSNLAIGYQAYVKDAIIRNSGTIIGDIQCTGQGQVTLELSGGQQAEIKGNVSLEHGQGNTLFVHENQTIDGTLTIRAWSTDEDNIFKTSLRDQNDYGSLHVTGNIFFGHSDQSNSIMLVLDLDQANLQQGDTYDILSGSSLNGGKFTDASGNVLNDGDLFSVTAGTDLYSFYINYLSENGKEIVRLTVESAPAIPELATSALLIALFLLPLCIAIRRKQR